MFVPQDIDVEVQSVDGEELDCEPARAGSDGQKAAAVAPWSLVCTATLAEMKPKASQRKIGNRNYEL